MDTGCAARLNRVLSATSARERQAKPMGNKITKTLLFLVILLAVIALLTCISPKAM